MYLKCTRLDHYTMKYGIKEQVLEEIRLLAQKYDVEKVILFGWFPGKRRFSSKK